MPVYLTFVCTVTTEARKALKCTVISEVLFKPRYRRQVEFETMKNVA